MNFWYKKNIFSLLLWPFSWAYRLIIYLRYWLYQLGLFKIHYFSAPIIVVGNISVGGTGKTPLVAHLVKQLQQQGKKVGIVSRGYQGKAARYPQVVLANSDAAVVGDEALWLVQQTQAPMVVDPKRTRAVEHLLAQQVCDVIISDDGLQHYALDRDVEIAVIDAERGLGNGFCLPAGPLREPKSRLNKVNFIIINGESSDKKSYLPGSKRDAAISMQLVPGDIYNLTDKKLTLTEALMHGKTLHAVAGIGHPQRFFSQLTQLGYNIIPHAFADHHQFIAADLDFGEDVLIIMTEKDAVKCHAFADWHYWVLPVSVSLSPDILVSLMDVCSAT